MKEKILTVLLLLLLHFSVKSQIISGKVMDENKNALPYTNIGIVGLDKGTISSNKGLFSIDISNINKGKILRFSFVGFKSVDFTIGDLISDKVSRLNIIMNKETFQLDEIIIKSNNEEPIYIGAKKRGRMSWIWSESTKGAEIGTLFKINKPTLLKKIYFYINKSYCDSIHYRLRIYDGTEEFPVKIINTKDIRFISKTKKGWESIDISNYDIKIDTDFIITLETLESWTSGKYRTTHLSVSRKQGNSYSKTSSMAQWTEFGNEMSFKIEIRE